MIFLYSDYITQAGGIETYLHALALHLKKEGIPFRVAVAEVAACPLLDELEEQGIEVYRQFRVPGDTWAVRQRVLLWWLRYQIKPGDWVYCVRQPMPQLYLKMVRMVHGRGTKIAASWMLAPEFLPPEPPYGDSFCQAVHETDAVISVSECTKHQFKDVYGYDGPIQVVRYHNLRLFDTALPLPLGPPWKIGYTGRISIKQKNLDTLLKALELVVREQPNVELHLYGGGSDQKTLEELANQLGIRGHVIFHGAYDHRTDLDEIIANCHFFVYTSRFEGGPCFTLLELLQAGRFVVASPVGGIPDIYEGHPEAGMLVDPVDPVAISQVLRDALHRVQHGEVDGEQIRARYFEEFDIDTAHRAWSSALKLGRTSLSKQAMPVVHEPQFSA